MSSVCDRFSFENACIVAHSDLSHVVAADVFMLLLLLLDGHNLIFELDLGEFLIRGTVLHFTGFLSSTSGL